MTEMQIDAVTSLPIETSTGPACGCCVKHLERKVRHADAAAVRECYRRTAIEIEIDRTRTAAELRDRRVLAGTAPFRESNSYIYLRP